MDGSKKPSVRDALFGDLPPNWRGGPAPAPTAPPVRSRDLGWSGWKRVLLGVYREFNEDRVLSVSGGVTFFALLALFPAITMLVSIYGLYADPATITEHLSLLDQVLPVDVVNLVRDQVNHIVETPTLTLSATGILSFLIAVYSATGGMKALIESMNLAWSEHESRGLLMLNLVGLLFTVAAILLLLMLLALVAVLPIVLSWLRFPIETQNLVSLSRWPALFGILTVAFAALYRWAPDHKQGEAHRVLPGAPIAAFAMVIASAGFSWYVTHLAHYSKTYGSLGAAVVLMMWLWIASIIIMIGAEINGEISAEIKRQGPPEETEPT